MDGYLEPFKDALKSRFSKAQQWIKKIDETEGGLEKFSRVSSTQLRQLHTELTASTGLREVWFPGAGQRRCHIPRVGAKCYARIPHR
jgi:hypothetical protein